jgi:hypothetical protein
LWKIQKKIYVLQGPHERFLFSFYNWQVVSACKRYKSLTGDKNGWLPVIKLQCRLVTAKHFTCVMPGHHGHDYDHMVVGFLTTYAISFYHH